MDFSNSEIKILLINFILAEKWLINYLWLMRGTKSNGKTLVNQSVVHKTVLVLLFLLLTLFTDLSPDLWVWLRRQIWVNVLHLCWSISSLKSETVLSCHSFVPAVHILPMKYERHVLSVFHKISSVLICLPPFLSHAHMT